MRWPRVRHRVSQFARAFGGALQPVDMEYAGARLGGDLRSAGLLALFSSMPRAEQHHGTHICRVLEQQGFSDGDLLAAALLHDVGKTVAPLRLWERVSVVLVERLAPRLAAEWADVPAGELVPVGVRRGFVVSRHHSAWGADLAARAGASPRTMDWIRKHHDPVDAGDPLLLALQDADEA
ncbi:MAG: HD domain-containing protein [Anaerolineae bacterium]|nr:HD domain-containing protein [Anaerolineae bacterium]